MNHSWIACAILIFSMVIIGQTLQIFAQISDAVDQGIDLTGDTVSGLVDSTVPVPNAGNITKEGFSIIKAVFQVMRSIHHFITAFLTTVMTYDKSEEEAAKLASIITIGSIIATIVLGLRLLRGFWRHIFTIIIIVVLLIIGISLLDNNFDLGL